MAKRAIHDLKGFDDQTDFFEQVGGAIMMGIGGVLAMGCTIGQGLTGMSTLSFGSSLAAVSICIGGFIGERLGRKNANALAAKMGASQ